MANLRERVAGLHLGPAVRLVWESAPRLMVASVLVVVLQSLVPLVPLLLIRLIVDSITEGAAPGYLLGLVAGAAGATAVSFALRPVGGLVRQAQAARLSDHVQSIIHEKSLEVDLEYYDGPAFYDKLYRAQEEAPYRPAAVVEQLMSLLRTVVSMVGILALVASVLPWYAVAALVVASGPLGLARSVFSRREFARRMRRTMPERAVAYLNWLLTGKLHAKELRIFGLSRFLQEQSAQKREELRRERLSLQARRSVAEVLSYLVQTAVVFGVIALVTLQALRGEASLGDLVLLLQAVQRAQSTMSDLLGAINGLYESNLFLKLVFEFLGLKPVVVDPEAPRPVPAPITQGLEVRNVSFRYPNGDHLILDDVSLSIGPGEIVSLVGDNGAGKTTLLKLLCRFYDPLSGSVAVDGVDLRELSKEAWWAQVTALFQDYAQYHNTVWENIWFGRTDAVPDSERIRSAAHAARADGFIEALPEGYDTPLGRFLQEGAEPSGGQWKKLALARTFYRDSPVALLDEPTSSLDPETEAALLRDLRAWGRERSVLLVTHRIAAARIADRIYVMREGRIVEHGSHDELVTHDGAYARMYRIQLDQMEGRYT